jgi:hypothetical protein
MGSLHSKGLESEGVPTGPTDFVCFCLEGVFAIPLTALTTRSKLSLDVRVPSKDRRVMKIGKLLRTIIVESVRMAAGSFSLLRQRGSRSFANFRPSRSPPRSHAGWPSL